VIDLENAQIRMRIAIRECIEAGPENDVLPRTALDSIRQLIFGIAAARNYERCMWWETELADSSGIEINRAASSGPMIATAKGSSRTFGLSSIWWAARRAATRNAVRLG